MTTAIFFLSATPELAPGLYVCALGYETRAVHGLVQTKLGVGRLAAAFPETTALNYHHNRGILLEHSFAIYDFDSGEFKRRLRLALADLNLDPENGATVCVDFTSMSRPMMADVVSELAYAASRKHVTVTFLYSPAVFHQPSEIEATIQVSEPVTPEFAGWADIPEQAVSTVIGLGFEGEQALGSNEFLEPAGTWLFSPQGYDPRFDALVADRNAELIKEVGKDGLFYYPIAEPSTCFEVLEGLVFGLLKDSRPVLICLGPKVFTIVSLLVAVVHAPKVTVWRVSGSQSTEPVDRLPNGELVSFTVKLYTRQPQI